ncbi:MULTISPECIES: hypothetical protein [Halorubrum]|uniref:hypothetical protein n=1 Tax=Halorubrum TaxID=56688 RepID=UPI0013DDAE1C|nr:MULTISPECIES: hypothetical protein [Halorubrum]MDB2283485.1 hypothetical protein [Halorubrum ezzemoulense]
MDGSENTAKAAMGFGVNETEGSQNTAGPRPHGIGELPNEKRRGADVDVPTLDELVQDIQRGKETEIRVGMLESEVEQNQDKIANAFSRIENIDEDMRDVEAATQSIDETASRLETVESTFEERVTSLEKSVSDMESAIQSSQINLHTVDFLYRGAMITGAIVSLVAAIALAVAYQLITVVTILVLTAGFFVWSFNRGIALNDG